MSTKQKWWEVSIRGAKKSAEDDFSFVGDTAKYDGCSSNKTEPVIVFPLTVFETARKDGITIRNYYGAGGARSISSLSGTLYASLEEAQLALANQIGEYVVFTASSTFTIKGILIEGQP